MTSNHGFSVVEFLQESGALFVVPCSWIDGNENNNSSGKLCAWPPYKSSKKIESLVREGVFPNPPWELLPINEIGKSKSYNKAVRKLKEYEERSDVDFSTDVENLQFSLPGTPRAQQVVRSLPSFSPVVEVSRIETVQAACTNCLNTEAMLRQLSRKMDLMHEELEEHRAQVQKILKVQVAEVPRVDYLPITEIINLKEFNDSLADSVEFAKAVKVVGLLGGRDDREGVRRVMARLIANELAAQLNWCENETKNAMKDFGNVLQLVAVCVRQNPPLSTTSQSSVDDAIKRWLRNAIDRVGGRKRRKLRETENFNVTV